ncbi:MAG: metallophosphatase family protein [Chitinispirillia bacterium]|nr:metallophosphatase family protein [Chitinispirillia bacterium]
MRIAFISDIHANLEALQAVFSDIDRNRIDEVICLGDIVGYGANPNECVDIITKRCPVTLLGNHDIAAINLEYTHNFNIHARIAIEWTSQTLTEANKSFLKALPTKKTMDALTLVHSTPYEPDMWYYITSLEEAAFNFQFFTTRVCIVGHTHIPMIVTLEGEDIRTHQEKYVSFKDKDMMRLLINSGSVGQPRDRDNRSCYGILDTRDESFTIRRVAYNFMKAQEKMRKIKMPEFLITRLGEGR